MTIHDLNGKTQQPQFWHAMPRKWNGTAYIQGQPVQVVVNGIARTVYLADGASCNFADFLRKWSDIDGAAPDQAAAWYAQWWGVGPADSIRVFLLSSTEVSFPWTATDSALAA